MTSSEAVKWALKVDMLEPTTRELVRIARTLATGGSGVAFLGRGRSIGNDALLTLPHSDNKIGCQVEFGKCIMA